MPGKRGRPRATVDLEEVEKLAALQCTHEEIAAFVNIGLRTFVRRSKEPAIAEALARGKAKGRVSVRRSLFQIMQRGQGGSAAAGIFLAKNLLGYRDVSTTEMTGAEGGPIDFRPGRPDFSQLSDEDLRTLEAITNKMHVGSAKASAPGSNSEKTA